MNPMKVWFFNSDFYDIMSFQQAKDIIIAVGIEAPGESILSPELIQVMVQIL